MTLDQHLPLAAVLALWALKPGREQIALAAARASGGARAAAGMMVGVAGAQTAHLAAAMGLLSALAPPCAERVQTAAAGVLIAAAAVGLSRVGQPVASAWTPRSVPESLFGGLGRGFSLAALNPLNAAFFAGLLPVFALATDPASIAALAAAMLGALAIAEILFLARAPSEAAHQRLQEAARSSAAAANAALLFMGCWIVFDNAGVL